jgi:hypothetical protein
MMRNLGLMQVGLCAALALGGAGSAHAQSSANKPAATNHQCWGQVASQLARLSDPTVTGGGMGAHSRSGTAAANNGGFADNTLVPITQPRTGVGNVSKGAPHNTAPGDGGNGQHAVNNGEFFADTLIPVRVGTDSLVTWRDAEPSGAVAA